MVERARPQYDHESKRLPGLKDGASRLDKDRDLLEEQTVAKNREFKRRVTAIKTREERVYAKAETEVQERERELRAFKVCFLSLSLCSLAHLLVHHRRPSSEGSSR